jgi:hypothetical protein
MTLLVRLRRRLRCLTLTNCELQALPPVVAGLGTLELLRLDINQLQARAAAVQGCSPLC